jgi:hypothetical protein
MVSESSGVEAILVFLMVVQVLIFSLHSDGEPFSFLSFNNAKATTDANDDKEVSYKYVSTTTIVEELINPDVLEDGSAMTNYGLGGLQHDRANDLRILRPNAKQTRAVTTAKAREADFTQTTNTAVTAKGAKTQSVKSSKTSKGKGTKSSKGVSPTLSAITATLQGLTMTLFGIRTFPRTAQSAWERLIQQFSQSSNHNLGRSVSNFDTTFRVTGFSSSQMGVLVEFSQT